VIAPWGVGISLCRRRLDGRNVVIVWGRGVAQPLRLPVPMPVTMPEISPVVMIVGTLPTPQLATLNGSLTKYSKHLPLHNAFASMKRPIPNIDTAQQSRCVGSISRRRKTQHVDPTRRRTSPPFSNPSNHSTSTSQLSHAPFQSFAYTEEAFKHTEQPVPNERAPSIQHWLETCSTDSDPDMMAAPPTP
jgi:hypothetical protein